MGAPFPPVLFEIINCVIWTSALAAEVIIGRYIAASIVSHQMSFFEWRARDRMAVALAVVFAGIIGVRGWTWLGRFLANTNHDANWMSGLPWVLFPIVACIVQALGLICVARVLTPDDWGRWGWLGCLAFTAAITATTLACR